jgi:hypothetical protein
VGGQVGLKSSVESCKKAGYDYNKPMSLPEEFNPELIEEPTLRQAVLFLMNQVEALESKVKSLALQIQLLKDENNRLKGEQPKPKIKPTLTPKLLSSELERKVKKSWRKAAKLPTISINREEILKIDPATLPADAKFKGYKKVVVQDIALTTNNVCFLKEVYYSPSQHKTYLPTNPPGYDGQFGPTLKALALTLYFDSGLSEPKLKSLFSQAGISISSGQLSKLVAGEHALFHQEKQAVLQAGLASSPWQHIDSTITNLNGSSQNCHVLCNPLYTYYLTLPQRDRLTAIDVLRGGAKRVFRFNLQ